MKEINYKLINILLILIILFFIYKLFPLLNNIINLLNKILGPIIISFVLSYSIYPIKIFINKKFNNKISNLLTIILIIIIIFILFYFSLPIMIKELNFLLEELINFIPKLYNYKLPDFIINILNNIISSYSNNIYITSISLLTKSLSFIINMGIIIIMSISLFINMDKIRIKIKNIIKDKDVLLLISKIDGDLYSYIKSIFIIIIIEIIEYTLIYFIIGHPYYYLLGFLAGVTTIIPYFGALFTNLVAFITSINISNKLFIFTILVALIIPIFDNYIIDPKIMSKSVKLSFLEVITSIIVSSSLFGIIGFIIATPLYIIVKNIILFKLNKFNL